MHESETKSSFCRIKITSPSYALLVKSQEYQKLSALSSKSATIIVKSHTIKTYFKTDLPAHNSLFHLPFIVK